MTRGVSMHSRPLFDTYREVRPIRRKNENTIHDFSGDTKGRRIDWIMVSSQFRTQSAAIDRTHFKGRYPSDHFPVQAVLQWPTPVVTGESKVAVDPAG